jgi:hypothetical protein
VARFTSYTLGSALRCRPSNVHVAVNQLCFVAEDSRVLALLGVRTTQPPTPPRVPAHVQDSPSRMCVCMWACVYMCVGVSV